MEGDICSMDHFYQSGYIWDIIDTFPNYQYVVDDFVRNIILFPPCFLEHKS